MRIGIDIQALRQIPCGIRYYLWNLVDGLCRLEHSHSLTLYLYGEPWLEQELDVDLVKSAFPAAGVQYYWDGIPPKLLSNGGKGKWRQSWFAKQLDSVLLPL